MSGPEERPKPSQGGGESLTVSNTLFKELEAKPRSPENEVKAAGSMNLSQGQGHPKPQGERAEIPGRMGEFGKLFAFLLLLLLGEVAQRKERLKSHRVRIWDGGIFGQSFIS